MKRILLVFVFALLAAPWSKAQAHSNTIAWLASPSAAVTGYNVYKASGSCSATFSKITATPVVGLTYKDTGMVDGAVNCYYIKSVAPSGESTQSDSILAITPTTTAAPPVPPSPPGTVTNLAQ